MGEIKNSLLWKKMGTILIIDPQNLMGYEKRIRQRKKYPREPTNPGSGMAGASGSYRVLF